MIELCECDLDLDDPEIFNLLRHERNRYRGLSRIVTQVGNRFCVDVCSLYLLDTKRRWLTLSATVGLRQSSIGKVRMTIHEGLVGLVALQEAWVAVSHAQEHPCFKYFPEAGEELYHSFLGAPIEYSGRVLGVLVIQTIEPRDFAPEDIDELVKAGHTLGRLLHPVSTALAPSGV